MTNDDLLRATLYVRISPEMRSAIDRARGHETLGSWVRRALAAALSDKAAEKPRRPAAKPAAGQSGARRR